LLSFQRICSSLHIIGIFVVRNEYSRCSGKVNATRRAFAAAVLAILMLSATAHALEWGGMINTAYSTTHSDTAHTTTIDQQYSMNTRGDLFPTFHYYAALQFRRLQIAQRDTAKNWLTELNPTASGVWTLPLFRLSSDYSYRDNHDRNQTEALIGRSAGISLQSTWQTLPMLQGYYNWNQNINDLDLLGKDTRQQTIGATASYSAKASTVRYDFNDNRTHSPVTGLSQSAQHHTASFDNSLRLLHQALTIQSSYRVTARLDNEHQAGTDGVLLALSPLTGLYAADPDPEFGSLETLNALVDGNLDSVASRRINLSSGEVHNIGLDLGSAADFDRLFLYTDTLASPTVRWAIYTSLDNQSWIRVRDYQNDAYSEVFHRYEISFDRLTSRYVKLVMEPQPAERPVFVTELRALIVRAAVSEAGWDSDHQASVQTRFHPANWLFMSLEGSLSRVGAGPTTLGRNQEGTRASLRVQPTPLFELSAQYQLNQTTYTGGANPRTTSELTGASARSRWLPSLETVFSATLQQEYLAGTQNRRLLSGSAQLRADLLPDLNTITESGLSQDERFGTSSHLRSRYISETMTARPLEILQLAADYRLSRFDAVGRYAPSSRQSLNLHGTLRLTSTITAQGEASQSSEAERMYNSWDALLGWLPTPKLSLSASANRELPDQTAHTTLLTLQGLFRATPRMDFSGSYSYFDSGESATHNYSSLRFGFNLSL
jgi:hypothetical protein